MTEPMIRFYRAFRFYGTVRIAVFELHLLVMVVTTG